jgi:hypothetical protein
MRQSGLPASGPASGLQQERFSSFAMSASGRSIFKLLLRLTFIPGFVMDSESQLNPGEQTVLSVRGWYSCTQPWSY